MNQKSMNLINNVLTNSEDKNNKLQKKYYAALEALEKKELFLTEQNELYRHALSRLCIISEGIYDNLDPQLKQLRSQLNKGVSDKKLARVLTQFSNHLLSFNDTKAAHSTDSLNNSQLLLEFLLNQKYDKRTEKKLKILCQKYEEKKIASASQLISLLNSLCTTQSASLSAPHSLDIEIAFIKTQLINLIQTLEVPKSVKTEANRVIEALQTLSDSNFQQNISDSFALLHAIQTHSQYEKEDITYFLSQVTEQLSELAISSHHIHQYQHESQHSEQNLGHLLYEKIQGLKEDSAKATQLEPLKSLIQNELALLKTQIQTHKEANQNLQNKTDSQMNKMEAEIATMKQHTKDLEAALEKSTLQSRTDPLTKLPNRLAYNHHFAIEFSRWERTQSPLSLLIWDIDLFKLVNDNYGHKAGDKTLIIIASLLQKYCRQTDFVSRFGGEGFSMLLSNSDKKASFIFAEKIRKIIEKASFTHAGKEIRITISCGIADLQQGDTHENLFERADKALYQAKDTGRNKVVIL